MNSIHGTIPTEVGYLSRSQYSLDLAVNSFYGKLPTEIGYLSTMTNNLNTRTNDITGEIPTEIGKLSMLSSYGLFMNDNSHTGAIPTELGSLSLLLSTSAYFRLQYNKLCDDVPTEVAALSSEVSSWIIALGNSLGTPCDE